MFLIAAILFCTKTQVINATDTWNMQDAKALERATAHCGDEYKDAPCLKIFKKSEQGVYSAICGSTATTSLERQL
jgi:hypothetical protein